MTASRINLVCFTAGFISDSRIVVECFDNLQYVLKALLSLRFLDTAHAATPFNRSLARDIITIDGRRTNPIASILRLTYIPWKIRVINQANLLGAIKHAHPRHLSWTYQEMQVKLCRNQKYSYHLCEFRRVYYIVNSLNASAILLVTKRHRTQASALSCCRFTTATPESHEYYRPFPAEILPRQQLLY